MSKDFLKDGFENSHIILIINDIRNEITKDANIINSLKIKYKDFMERYPSLFEMAIQSEFDFKAFEYMMNLRKEIIENKTDVEVASKEVGQTFFDKYMK
jgi:hypothetical protein